MHVAPLPNSVIVPVLQAGPTYMLMAQVCGRFCAEEKPMRARRPMVNSLRDIICSIEVELGIFWKRGARGLQCGECDCSEILVEW